ncbi:MAG TPA: IS1595 family transposase [Blastocatellia bacterium]|nr:IS1595 family transposase [Blastocatellia bacterium]
MTEKQNAFPKTLQAAVVYFANPDNALDFMISLRWPNGIACPHCTSDRYTFISTRLTWQCLSCKKTFTVKLGTVMEDSPIGLDKWLCATWMIVNAKNGISSYEIARSLGITQKSAWFLAHRIRLAMQTGTFEKLGGDGHTVEADETFIRGAARFMHKNKRAEKISSKTGFVGKVAVMGLLERCDEGSRVRCKVIAGRRKDIIHEAVRDDVKEGSELHTDDLGSCRGLDEYVHKVVDHAVKYVEGNVHTNGLENFWSLLKRCIKGTYVSVEPFHLFRYLDEQSFRFNARKVTDQIRFLAVSQMIIGRRVTYKQLTGELG